MTSKRGRPATATLFVQVLILVLASLAVAQAVNLWAIFHLPRPAPEYYTGSDIAQALKAGPAAAPARTSNDARGLTVITATGSPPKGDPRRNFDRLAREIATDLAVSPATIVVTKTEFADERTIRDVRERLRRSGGRRQARFLVAPFQVWARQPSGEWLVASPPRPPFPTPWQTRIILWFVITTAAMTPAAWLVARRLSSSVALFSEAAERLGRDPNAPPLPVKGPAEIMPAITAFNEMQDRVRRYVNDRTAMAAAMAHDLRTPLTRLRFRIESAPADVRAKMETDIEEMEAMIAASLAYVRDDRAPLQSTPLELSSLLESIVDDMAETGAPVVVEQADRVVITGDPVGLKRLVSNLIENAVKFGGAARCRVIARDGWAVIEVEDDGPGVPQADLDKVFEPFYRGEPSRSRQTGGSGLGLAAVRTIAQAHGGDAILLNRPGKGLIAVVRLPV